jgi:hypothetical protein
VFLLPNIAEMPSTANSGANGQRKAYSVLNATVCTTGRTHEGEVLLLSKILAHLCVLATRPLPLVINEDPNHKRPSEADILHTNNENYSPQAELQSLHLDKDNGLKSEDEIKPEDDEIKPKGDEFKHGGNTNHGSNNAMAAAGAAVPGRHTLCCQYAMVSIAVSLWKPTHLHHYSDRVSIIAPCPAVFDPSSATFSPCNRNKHCNKCGCGL